MAQLANYLQLTLNRIQRLYEISAALSGTLTPTQIAEAFISHAITDGGASAGVVAVLSEGNLLESAGSSGYLPDCVNHWQQFALDESNPVAEAARTQQAVWIESLAGWDARYPALPVTDASHQRWAALPLITRGRTIGSIAFAFVQSAAFSEEDKVYLSAVAYQCAQALDRAQFYAADLKFRQNAEAERDQATTILENITDAFVSLDRAWCFTYVNREAERIMGYPREKLLGQTVLEIFPDYMDSSFFLKSRQAIADQQHVEFEAFATPINKWIYSHVYPFKNGVSIYFQDITERKRTEQALRSSETRLQHFINANLIGVITATNNGQITEANDAFLKMVGYSRQELEAGTISWLAMTPPEYLPLDEQAISHAQRTGVGLAYEKEYSRKDGSRVPILIGGVLNDGVWTSFVMDLTERKHTESKQRFLAEASGILSGLLDDTEIYKSIAQLIVPTLADWCTIDMWQPDGTLKRMAIVHTDPKKVAWANEMWERYPIDMNAPAGLPRALKTGLAELHANISDEQIVASTPDPQQLAIARQIGYSSVIVIPLLVRGQVLGGLNLVWAESKRHYTPDDVAFAQDLAQRVALAIDNARLFREANEQREHLRVTLASIGDAVIATNMQGRITFMNAVAESLTGWRIKDTIDQPLEDIFRIINEDIRQPIESPVARVLSTGSGVGVENRVLLVAKDGTEIPIDDSAAPIRDDKGQTIGTVLTFRDISERKRAADRVRFLAEVGAVLAASLDYETTFQNMARLLIPSIADNFTIDLLAETGELRRVTLAASEPLAEAALHEMRDRYPPDPHSFSIRQVLSSGQSMLAISIPPTAAEAYAQDAHHLALIQRIGTISYIVLPLIVRGRPMGVMSIGMADSGRRYNEDDMKFAEELARRAAQAVDNARLYQDAQEAIRIRETFLTIAAHELRTPITSIVGTTQLLERHALRDKSLPEADMRLIQTVKVQTRRLTAMIQALLDVSRIERGQLTLERQPLDLRGLVRRIIDELQPTLIRHNLDYTGPETPLIVDIDEMRIEQAIQNLINNAIKYSPQGGVITLRVQQEAEMARVAITDSGIGIPRDALPRLFTQFYRAPNAEIQQIGGIGIGLYLVHETVVLHGGRVEVESEEGHGSTFTLYLPLVAPLSASPRVGESKG